MEHLLEKTPRPNDAAHIAAQPVPRLLCHRTRRNRYARKDSPVGVLHSFPRTVSRLRRHQRTQWKSWAWPFPSNLLYIGGGGVSGNVACSGHGRTG
jgi:hypothetical protein